ncbi:MAG: hypothetical protein LUE93_17200 [Bacteroides sp.]|nr:hypothetical protein [Bacteroides sp.]
MSDILLKPTLEKVKSYYLVFWGINLALIVAFETGLLPEGLYAGDARMEYILETIGILLVIAMVPLSLKLFSRVLHRKIDRLPFAEALQKYQQWSLIRVLLLLSATLYNIVVYYLTLHSIGALCLMIGLTASLFCIPGEKRIRRELQIDGQQEPVDPQ